MISLCQAKKTHTYPQPFVEFELMRTHVRNLFHNTEKSLSKTMMLPRISTAKQRLSVKKSKESEFFMCACTITELLESSFFLFVEK